MNEFCIKTAAAISGRLKEQENKERSESVRKYFKNTVHSLGTGLPAVGKTIRKFLPEFACAGHDEIIKTADILLKTKILEIQTAGIELLRALKENLSTREAFFQAERWILDGIINNWATTDDISVHLLGPLVERDTSLSKETLHWTSSHNPWLRRASAVTYILLAREGKFLETVYKTALAICSDNDEYVRKGAGWALREAGKTDMKRLSGFLYEHGTNMSRITLRYAIEKFPPVERKKLLEKTRK